MIAASLPRPPEAPEAPDTPPAIPDAMLEAKSAAKAEREIAIERVSLGGDVDLVVAVRRAKDSEGTPAFAMALVQAGKVLSRRDGLSALTGMDAEELAKIGQCDGSGWNVGAAREDLGPIQGVRVGAACRYGEDYYTGTEYTVLYRLPTPAPRDLGALERLWSGEGAYLHSEMDSCVTSREVRFRLLDAKTLQKTMIEQTRWVDQKMDAEFIKSVRQSCKVGTKRAVERLSLPAAR